MRVIDTVGFKIGPFSAVDQYGTPFTQALHVAVSRKPGDSRMTSEVIPSRRV
jgi:hypothetical protein